MSDVFADSVEVIDHRSLPDGIPFFDPYKYLPTVACEWIKTRGRLIGLSLHEEKSSIMLEIVRNDQFLDVKLPYSPESEKNCLK